VGTVLAPVVDNRIREADTETFSASATIVCPDMGVLSDLDPSHVFAITADVKVNVWEACRSILERATVRDLGDPGVVAIKWNHFPMHVDVAVPCLVETGSADRVFDRLARDARRHLVVNVKVLGATLLVLTANLAIAAMLGEHLGSIVVTLEVTISKEELAHFFAELVAIDPHVQLCADNVRPKTIVVDLEADGVAVLVVCFASFIDASLATTLGDGHFKCDNNGAEVFTKHRSDGKVSREDEKRCTEHLDIDYQVPACIPCEPVEDPICAPSFHKTWYSYIHMHGEVVPFDCDNSRIAEISDCCPLENGATCFPDIDLDISCDGKHMTWIKVAEHSHVWAYNRCRCTECFGVGLSYPIVDHRCEDGAHTLKRPDYAPKPVVQR
jgi:hypothetical protein